MQSHIISYMLKLVAKAVKNLPVMQETWVRSQGQEDSLEKEMATHSRVPPWKIPWVEEPGGLSPWAHKELDRAEQPTYILYLYTYKYVYV